VIIYNKRHLNFPKNFDEEEKESERGSLDKWNWWREAINTNI